MDYSVLLLTSAADCDALLQSAQLERTDLDYKKYQQSKKRDNVTTNSATIEADITSTEAEIAAYQAAIPGLPDPSAARKILTDKLTRSNYQLYVLNARHDNNGVLSILEQEYEINCIEKSIAESEGFITALTARKVALGG